MKKRITAICLAISLIFAVALPINAQNEAAWDRADYYKKSLSRYSQFDISDQNYITDEAFFGTWNGSAWEKEPLFDYATHSNMAEIEENAKLGNYEGCKEALLAYYRERYKNFNITNSVSKNVTDAQLADYERVFDNFFIRSDAALSGRIVVGKEASWQSVTVTEELENLKGATFQKRIFQLAASQKDGYAALLSSRESENTPYIEARVNGNLKKYYPVKDSYIKVGNADRSFGDEETLRIEESVSSIGKDPLRPVDSYTKTAFIQFDFSGLKETDVITEAKLYIYGYMRESDNPEGIVEEKSWKSIYVLPFTLDTSVDVETFTYNKYKAIGNPYQSFDGEGGRWYIENKETGEIDINLNSRTPMVGWPDVKPAHDGYIATGNEAFAYHALRIMLHQIKVNGNQELRLKRDNSYNIGVAFRTAEMSWTFPIYLHALIKSEYMTPAVFTAIMKNMYDCGEILVKAWSEGEELNNWGGYNCMALQYMYFFFPEFKMAKAPLIEEPLKAQCPGSVQGGWKNVEIFRRKYKAMQDFYEDGTSVEISSEYQMEGIETLLEPLTVAAMVGADLKDGYDSEMLERLEKAALYMLSHWNPVFGDWGTGDSASYTTNFPRRLKPILKLVDNPFIEYVATRRASGKEPDFLTSVNDTFSKVTFRNSWEDTAVAGHLENSGGAGSHGHNDDLSLVVSAYGQYLLADTRSGSYDVTEPKERWASSTRGHNTVEINDTIAKGSKYYHEGDTDYFGDTMIVPIRQTASKVGDLHPENREINNIYDFVRGESFGYTDHNRLDSDFKVMRDVLFLHDGYFIVTDYIKPENMEKKNTYRQLWHFLPSSNFSADSATNTIRTNYGESANIVVATVKNDFVNAPERKLGLYAGSKNNFNEADYAFFRQDKVGITTFNTLLYPLQAGQNADVTTTSLELDIDDAKANAFRADITDKSNSLTKTVNYYTLFDTTLQKDRAFGDFETDGEVALSEKTGAEYTMAILRRGTKLKDTLNDTYLIFSEEKLEDIGIRWSGNSIYIAAEEPEKINLNKLTILAENKINSVYLNEKSVNFIQNEKYVEFTKIHQEDFSWIRPGGSGTVTLGWDFKTVRYAEDDTGNLIDENGSYKTITNEITGGKFTDNHFCTTRQMILLKDSYLNSDGNIDGTAVDEAFYESFDRVGEYVALNRFSTTVTNLRRIDLYLKSNCEVDFEVLVCQASDNENGYEMVSVYEGKTKKANVHNIRDNRTSEHVACYYPIVLDGATEVFVSGKAPGQIVIKVKGYDADGNPLPDGTLLPDGKKLQIAEMRIDYKNSNDIMGIGHSSQNMLTSSSAYYGFINTLDSLQRSADYNYNRVASPYFVGCSVSKAIDVDNPTTDRKGDTNSHAYIRPSSNEDGLEYCTSNLNNYPTNSWPVKGGKIKDAESAVIYKVVPNAAGECYWIGDMGEVGQALNHIKLNYASGKATKVSVYSSNTPSTSYDANGVGNGAFANPNHDSWELRGTAENATGIKKIYMHDNEPARLWMVKIEKYEGDFQLEPFNMYLRSELELPEYLGAEGELEGTLAPNETLTYSIDAENLSDEAKVLFALYEDDSLKVVTPVDIKEISESGKIDKAIATYKIPSDAEGILSCKAFFWNSLSELIPLRGVKSLPSTQ